ncbi:hypothetical protein DTO027I6_4073 [Penicillium roqueforti]|nr:hypothetical protein CBS147337_6036 [Penicillium roqueforti]KAI3211654.1 hypothetical protein DTO027I6_4073 [Penicillium roqueforti]
MPEREPRQFLPQMIGEGIITYCPYSDDPVLSSFYKARLWVIVEKLDEDLYTVTPEDSDQDMGPAFTTGKFLCRRGQHGYHAFMHIHKQIPLYGTEFNRSEDRENQASDMSPVELNALKKFTENECAAAPKLLGYQIDIQDPTDLVSGRFIIYLVFDKVPGRPLEFDEFWSFPLRKRRTIRENFRVAYMEILRLGYQPLEPSSLQLIYEREEDDMYVLLYP